MGNPSSTAGTRPAAYTPPTPGAPAGSPPAKKPVGFTTRGTWQSRISSHEAFSHDSIDHLGYDWGRVGNLHVTPVRPLKVYLPESLEEVVRCIKDANTLGEKIVVRSKGHSSNDLVLSDRGSILLIERLNKVLEINEAAMTATVMSGVVSAELDDVLADRGLGLPIIGDHNHITTGGFVSVGGISPASHRFGMFVDNVLRIQYVDWDGNAGWCSATENPGMFDRLRAGLGRHGVIVAMTVKLIRIDKYTTILRNEQTHYRTVDSFIAGSSKYLYDPGDALYERGVYVEFLKSNGKAAGDRAVLGVQADEAIGVCALPERGGVQLPARDRVHGGEAAGAAGQAVEVRGDHGSAMEPDVREHQEHRVLHGQDSGFDGGGSDADVHRAGAAGELRRVVPGVVRADAGVSGEVSVHELHLGVREEHQVAVSGAGAGGSAVLRADVLLRDQPDGDERGRAGGVGGADRRRDDQARRVPVHAQPDGAGPGTLGEGGPEHVLLAERRREQRHPRARAPAGTPRNSRTTLTEIAYMPYQREIPLYTLDGVRDADVSFHPFSTEDKLGLQLHRFSRGSSDDVVLIIHGLTTSMDMFIMPEHKNLVSYLLDNGFRDVWCLDFRMSNRFTYNMSPHRFTMDDIALYDFPPALEKIRQVSGDKRIHVICHCLGSVSFMMSLFGGAVSGITSVIANSVSLTPRVPTWSRLKISNAPFFVESVLSFPYLSPAMSDDPVLTRQKMFAKLVNVFHRECDDSGCHMLSLMWGTGWPALYMKAAYPEAPIGYSGHETGLAPTGAAVALGASFVERHITLDRAMWAPIKRPRSRWGASSAWCEISVTSRRRSATASSASTTASCPRGANCAACVCNNRGLPLRALDLQAVERHLHPFVAMQSPPTVTLPGARLKACTIRLSCRPRKTPATLGIPRSAR